MYIRARTHKANLLGNAHRKEREKREKREREKREEEKKGKKTFLLPQTE